MLRRLKAMFSRRKKQPDGALSWHLTSAALDRSTSDNPTAQRMGMAELDILSRSELTTDLDKSIAADALELHKRERQ
jgi:hypothetical protein